MLVRVEKSSKPEAPNALNPKPLNPENGIPNLMLM